MNRMIKTLGVLSISAFLLVSCERNDDLVTIGQVTAPAFLGDVSAAYVVTADNLEEIISIPVKAATYGISSEVRSELEIALAGTDFANPVTVGAYTTGEIITINYKQLNAAALLLGVKSGESTKMEMRVKSYLASIKENVKVSYSDVKTVDVTAYASGPVYNYEELYLIGDATAAGWDNLGGNISMYPLLKTSDNNVYSFVGYFKAGGFKMVKTKGDWGAQLGYASEGKLSTDGGSVNIPISAAGYYELKVNTKDLTYTLTPFNVSETEYSTVGIIGNATAKGWEASTPMVKSSHDPNMWVLKGVRLLAGEMKFRANDSWNVNWGSSEEFFGTAKKNVMVNIPVSEAYEYDIYFNSATGVYSIIPVGK